MTASKPVIVVEVSAPDTAVFDYSGKLREYRSVESVDTVIQIEWEIVIVKIHRRQQDDTWTEETIEGFDVDIPLVVGDVHHTQRKRRPVCPLRGTVGVRLGWLLAARP